MLFTREAGAEIAPPQKKDIIYSSFTHVVSNLYDSLFSVKHKRMFEHLI